MDIKEEHILGDRIGEHWYYVAKGRAMRQFLAGRHAREVIDVGAGSGIFSKQLLECGICEKATCVDPGYQGERSEMHAGHPVEFVRSIAGARSELILMMDVIEHVEDDVGLLRQYAGHLAEGGVIFITVPAFQFLWSGHDVFLEHQRRYTKEQLRETVSKAGLKVVSDRYFFAALFPLICGMRVWKKRRLSSGAIAPRSELRLHSRLVNALLVAAHDLERQSLFRVNRLAGLSVFCLATRA